MEIAIQPVQHVQPSKYGPQAQHEDMPTQNRGKPNEEPAPLGILKYLVNYKL